ncbi:alpha/beta hydrolase family protein [Streptomyces sp. NPDC101165]|uniref:alpha/beta hydrolase family protein n=1 Tax=Streptomyces sp. NPDC101165 TaxID=3366119 RepID=UPI00381C04C8
MKSLFENETFSSEALRTACYAAYGGADLGEMRENPVHDVEAAFLSLRVRETLAAAAPLLDHPAEPLSIPFEGTRLPGYLFGPDDCGEPRPTLIYHGGYDSVLEEGCFATATAAVRRGYGCLAFDGPGQGSVLPDQGLTFRPERETVVSAVVDFAVKRPEVGSERLVLIGTSFGGVLAARAAAFEHRLAAVSSCTPPSSTRRSRRGRRSPARRGRHRGPGARRSHGGGHRDALVRGQRDGAFGADTHRELLRKTRYHSAADQLPRPGALGTERRDLPRRGAQHRLTEALACPYRHILLTDAEGAGAHCHGGAMLAFHQPAFGWIDTVLTRCADGRN